MANNFGYPVVQTDRPGIWMADGYVSISNDGYGTPNYTTVPSGIVRSVTHVSTGTYSIILQDAWFALVDASIQTIIPAGSSPAVLVSQIQSFTVGNSAVLPVSAGGVGQSVIFEVSNLSGVATNLPVTGGFLFKLILKQSSA